MRLPSAPCMHMPLLIFSICESHSWFFVPALLVWQFFMVRVVVNPVPSSPSLKVIAPPLTHPVQPVLDQHWNCATWNHGGWVGILYIIILGIVPRAYSDLLLVCLNSAVTCALNSSQYCTCWNYTTGSTSCICISALYWISVARNQRKWDWQGYNFR